ncbi:Recombinase [Photobacterium marinum]|uniref:Recombinase n=1 Tax=Photobacterium marinum TaxID=1056511 RepID=L8JAZ9_9GAMM|nr:recombinase family protein [Photobacterium marinum]ELR66035.1 Recombinase [Photobacterium marinum]
MPRKAVLYGRYSTLAQEDGNSSERQKELAQAIAQQENLEIIKVYFDEGKSGYHGANLDGELGVLLKDIENGVIASGYILLVEELDRLSRQHLFKAQKQLTSILEKGIEIWTYLNGSLCKYNSENPMLLLQAIVKSQLAFEESDKKAARAKDNWKRKYADIRAGKFTRVKVAYWITSNIEAKRFELNEYAKGIEKIFELYTNGVGLMEVVRYLNEHNYPLDDRHVQKHENSWDRHKVLQVLKNPSTYGTFKSYDGKFVKHDYYPAVTSKDTFDLATSIRLSSSHQSKHKSHFVNMLSGLVVCPYCGHGFILNYTTNRGKRYYALRCNAGSACFAPSISLKKLEPLLFKYLSDLDWSTIFKNDGFDKDKLISDLDNAKKELVKLEELFERSGFNVKLGEAVASQSQKINNLQKELDSMLEVHPDFDFDVDALLDDHDLRAKAAVKLRMLVDHIELYTCGEMLDFRKIPNYDPNLFKEGIAFNKKNSQFLVINFKHNEKRQIGISSDYVAGVNDGVVYHSGGFSA